MRKPFLPLLRSAILDYPEIEALNALVWGDLIPKDLPMLEAFLANQ